MLAVVLFLPVYSMMLLAPWNYPVAASLLYAPPPIALFCRPPLHGGGPATGRHQELRANSGTTTLAAAIAQFVTMRPPQHCSAILPRIQPNHGQLGLIVGTEPMIAPWPPVWCSVPQEGAS